MRKDMKKGDTLIEVILAFSVFSAAMMGGLWLMNNAMARAQATLQLTMARNAMDGQAETLRFLNARHLSAKASGGSDTLWESVLSNTKESPSSLSRCPTQNSEFETLDFIVNPYNLLVVDSRSLQPAETYPRIQYESAGEDDNNIREDEGRRGPAHGVDSSQGLWVEAVREGGANYVDFHIRACWNAPGQNAPMTLGTIVRLYGAE